MTDREKLSEIISEIDVLIKHNVDSSNPEFKQWHSKTKRFLYHHYGKDSIEYKDFVQIHFSLYCFTPSTSEYEFISKCRKDLTTVKGILSDYLNDLQDQTVDSNNTVKTIETDCLETVFKRFRRVAVKLEKRHDDRETLVIKDEYDVQDLLYAILNLYFDDIRSEEWTPSYAGSSLRIDFLIPEIETVIEVKKTRPSMTDKKLSEELITDIEKYQNHPDCKKIYCFVYDPDNLLRNPAAIKNDLEKNHPNLLKVFIES